LHRKNECVLQDRPGEIAQAKPVSRAKQEHRLSQPGAKNRQKKTPFYRRAPFIVCYWQGAQLVFENFLAQRRVRANPLTATILHFFSRWRPFQELIAALNGYQPASLRRAVSLLTAHSLLQRFNRQRSPVEKDMAAWGEWNPVAGFFHLSTKDVEFEPNAEMEFRNVLRLAKSNPMPRPVKHYSKAVRVRLPRSRPASEFPSVLLARRTWREFSAQPVELRALGTLLGLSWGVQEWARIPQLGPVALKTSPSGGALHPIEAYVLARNVRGLRPGLYHYDGAAHRLDLLRRGASSRQIVKYLAGQLWFGNAAFVVFMTAVFARTQWKYDYPRAYRAVLMEAGHLCQTFCLTATWLGLAPFCTIAFKDSLIEQTLGVDGISESVLYAAGAGMRPPEESQAHLGTMGAQVSWRR
jgi:SagB-type dehydrogenase family enzyme